MAPKVTVIMGVYNRVAYLKEAIDSILRQTLSDFEFIIVDDGSTDGSWNILQQNAQKDSRLIVLRNKSNLGAPSVYNRCLQSARGEYIAIQDSDDISLPQRLEKQVAFLENHPQVVMLGSYARPMNQHGDLLPQVSKNPLSDGAIRICGLLYNCFIGATQIMRRLVIDHNNLRYDARNWAEDYYFSSLMLRHGKGANLGEILVHFRLHSDSVSRNWPEQERWADTIAQNNVESAGLGRFFTTQQICLMRSTGNRGLLLCGKDRIHQLNLLKQLFEEVGKIFAITNKDLKEAKRYLLRRINYCTPIFSNDWYNYMVLVRLLRLDPGAYWDRLKTKLRYVPDLIE